jgi:hypothetical protein
MRFGRVLPALLAFATTAMALMMLAGGGTAAAMGPDLSSSQGMDAYLQSLGVDPASVVHQSGQLNYAGPRCPGKGWNCTTSTRVVQVAAAGGQNRVDCSGASSTEQGQACVVGQAGGDNSARCIERSNLPAQSQSCTIVQTGAQNDALIDQRVDQNGGATQAVTQEASLTQTSTGRFNRASISQSAKQNTHDGPEEIQRADQAMLVNQMAGAGAENKLNADQVQDQDVHAGALQHQNWEPPVLADCYPASPSASPHMCANISQSSQAGDNGSRLRQVMTQNAQSSDVAVQLQGNFAGGIDARVHQDTVSGRQRNDANQDKRQHAHAPPGSTQTQVDPLFCCGVGSQAGGADNKESIDQASSQDASEPLAFQESTLIGQSLTPNGTCAVKQHARDNADATTNSASLGPCPFLVLVTECSSAVEEETGGCTAFAPITTPPNECGIECVALGPLTSALRPRS